MNPIKIFVVDDQPEFSQKLKVFLEDTGRFEVQSRITGKGAFSEIAEFRPDAVILDMRLEEDHQDGVVLADQFRKSGKLNRVPIFIITNFYSKGDAAVQEEGSSRRGIFYIAKSEAQLKLLARITQVFCEFRRGTPEWAL